MGTVTVVDFSGKTKTLTKNWTSVRGLAWSPNGSEIWFTASDTGSARGLLAVALDGQSRVLAAVPGELTLFAVDKSGRAVLTEESERVELATISTVTPGERELSWLDWSLYSDLSADGKTVLFTEAGEGGGPNYSVYLRKVDGSPAVNLGTGSGGILSPDGQWVAAFDTHRQVIPCLLMPTGAGQMRQLTNDKTECRSGAWLPDSKGVLLTLREPSKGLRVYLQMLDGAEPRPLTPEGYAAPRGMVQPDGKSFVARRISDGKRFLFPISGGEIGKELPSLNPGENTISWAADGRSFFTYQAADRKTALISKVDFMTGKREVVKEWMPADRAGVTGYSGAGISADGKTIVYSYTRVVGDVYLVDGLK
jgi:Tol biopolymer transport system component